MVVLSHMIIILIHAPISTPFSSKLVYTLLRIWFTFVELAFLNAKRKDKPHTLY